MNATPGPFITCFIVILFLSIYLYISIHIERKALYGETKVMTVLISAILIRMMIPFNFPFTISIPSRLLVFETIFFYKVPGMDLTWLNLLFVIWILGAVIRITYMLVRLYSFKNNIRPFAVRDMTKYPNLHEILKQNEVENLPIYLVPINISPVIVGVIHPVFVLPSSNFTEKELFYACEHEIQHYKNRDHWLKLFADFLLCIQWFNIPAYVLNEELDLCIEVANDRRVLDDHDETYKFDYAESIVNIACKIKSGGEIGVGLPLVSLRNKGAKTRVDYITSGNPNAKCSNRFSKYAQIVVIGFTLLVAFFVVPERYHVDDETKETTYLIETDNSYFIEDESGYSLFINGEYKLSFDYIPEDFKDLPIYQKED